MQLYSLVLTLIYFILVMLMLSIYFRCWNLTFCKLGFTVCYFSLGVEHMIENNIMSLYICSGNMAEVTCSASRNFLKFTLLEWNCHSDRGLVKICELFYEYEISVLLINFRCPKQIYTVVHLWVISLQWQKCTCSYSTDIIICNLYIGWIFIDHIQSFQNMSCV